MITFQIIFQQWKNYYKMLDFYLEHSKLQELPATGHSWSFWLNILMNDLVEEKRADEMSNITAIPEVVLIQQRIRKLCRINSVTSWTGIAEREWNARRARIRSCLWKQTMGVFVVWWSLFGNNWTGKKFEAAGWHAAMSCQCEEATQKR